MYVMFWLHLFYAVFFAALLSMFFYAVFRTRGPWSSLILLFLVLFLASWAGGVWLSPFGPGIRGTYWLPFLLSGLFIALLLAAAAQPSEEEESSIELVDTRKRERERRKVYRALSIFFWIIVAALVVAIAGHYFTT